MEAPTRFPISYGATRIVVNGFLLQQALFTRSTLNCSICAPLDPGSDLEHWEATLFIDGTHIRTITSWKRILESRSEESESVTQLFFTASSRTESPCKHVQSKTIPND